MGYLLRNPENGEQVYTDTPDGYPGWTVLAEGTAGEPNEHSNFENGEWKVDHAVANEFYHQKIDREAGTFRLHFVTDVPGQQATYIEKERQARAFLADNTATDVQMLKAEAAVRGITDEQMANMVLQIADQWRVLSAKIEAARIGAKEAVTAAQTEQDKLLAATVNWWAVIA